MEKLLKGRAVVPGQARGKALTSRQALSFWGGVHPGTGEVIDRRHDRSREIITGKVFVFPQGKGSSTGSAVLAESIRNRTAPAAIVTAKVDPILALGAIIADEMYHRVVPVVILSREDFAEIRDGDDLSIYPDGSVLISRP